MDSLIALLHKLIEKVDYISYILCQSSDLIMLNTGATRLLRLWRF